MWVAASLAAMLMQGLGQNKGLTGLFDRIANLGKGVVIGTTAGILFQIKQIYGF